MSDVSLAYWIGACAGAIGGIFLGFTIWGPMP
jgi:hypothetical protein